MNHTGELTGALSVALLTWSVAHAQYPSPQFQNLTAFDTSTFQNITVLGTSQTQALNLLGINTNTGGFAFNSGNPSIPSCPIAACYTMPGPVLTSAWLWGTATTNNVGNWLAVDSLYVGIGSGSNTFGAVGRYVGVMQGPSAGTSWGIATNIVRGFCPGDTNSLYGQPGSGIPFDYPGCSTSPGSLGNVSTIGYELDVSNFDADTATSGAFIVGLFINGLTAFTSGAGIFIGGHSTTGGVPLYHSGLTAAPGAAKDELINDLSNATTGIYEGGSHAGQSYYDAATTPVAMQFAGTYSGSTLWVAPASAVSGFVTGGTITMNGLWLADNAANGINVAGTRSANDILLSGSATYGINFTGTFTDGLYLHGSVTNGIVTGGTITTNAIYLADNAANGIDVQGKRSAHGILVQGTAPYGLSINGTFATAQIAGTGFYFDPRGYLVSTIPLAGTAVAT